MNVDVKRVLSELSDSQLAEMAKQLTGELPQHYCQDKNIVRAMVLEEYEYRVGEERVDDLIDQLGI